MNRIDLEEKDLPNGYFAYEGIESEIYRIDDNKLFKFFKKERNSNFNADNKINKLNILSELNMQENIFKDLVYVNNEFVGYTMSNLETKGYNATCCCDGRPNKRIEIAKMVWERLEQLHSLGITYGDIREANVLYNGKNIILCDMDNVRIDKYNFDKTNAYMDNYLCNMHFDYSLLDNYAFNIYFIGYYGQIYAPWIYSYLQGNNLMGRINNPECKQIVHDMVFLDENYKGELLIDHLTPTISDKLKRTLIKK